MFFIPLAPLVGMILGIVALTKAKGDPKALKGLAIAAIVIGAFIFILSVIFLGGLIAGMMYVGSQFDEMTDMTEMTEEECEILGGYVFNPSLDTTECPKNEIKFGDVTGVKCPCICCGSLSAE